MDKEYGMLNDDEVLFVNFGRILMSNPTFKVSEFLDALAQLVSEREAEWSEENEGWFGDGLECEALRLGNQGWQRGRVRIRLEFCPSDNKPKLLRNTSSRREEPSLRAEMQSEDYPPRDDLYRRPSRNDAYTGREEIYPSRDDTYMSREEIYREDIYGDRDENY
jgi:hypothetical protein